MSTNTEDTQTFEIGLVLAGAVSAGAYTAGVIDVLLEKLEAFEDYKAAHADEPDCPKHRVVIKVISGASAGAMTGVLAAANLAGKPTEDGSSRLKRAWVEQIDIAKLLDTRDLAVSNTVQSFMDCTVLDEIVDDALNLAPRDALPAYIADSLHMYLSVSNLRGVPYGLEAGGQVTRHAHEMMRHGDRMHFAVVNDAQHPQQADTDDAIPLARGMVSNTDERWKLLGQSALASGAFPMGLKPRVLSRKGSDYDRLKWPVPKVVPEQKPDGSWNVSDLVEIPPAWPDDTPDTYSFLNVDGGLINNEPLEWAREELAGIGGRNPRGPKEASRAVLMVDPFPDPVAFDKEEDYVPDPGIFSVAMNMFGALKMQARFKPDELRLANDSETFSRFIISPSRTEADGTLTRPAIMSDILGAFGGFLSQTYREHDYRLGRRNCERFLKRWFRLHVDNPLFGGWRDPKQVRTLATSGGDIETLPIIPVESPEVQENLLPSRPRASDVDLPVLRERIKQRLNAVVNSLIASELDNSFWAKKGWKLVIRKKVMKKVMTTIENGLSKLNPGRTPD